MKIKGSAAFAVCYAMSIVLCVVAASQLNQAKTAARASSANHDRMLSLKQEIFALRALSSKAMVIGEQSTEAASTWIDYAVEAGILESQFTEINRLPITTIEKTSYSRDDVVLRLTNVTAEQLMRFAIRCRDASIGYELGSVRLVVGSRVDPEIEVWNATLLLTRILFTAKNES